MKHIKYIAILIVSLFVSCTENDIVPNNHPNVVGKNQIQLVTRIAPFTEHDVTSRAVGDNQSVQYDFIIFGTGNKCVYYNHCNDEIINIDRANDFPGINQDLLNSCTIYVLTNYSGIYEKICQDAQDADYTDVTKYITEKIVGGEDIDYFAVIPTAVLPDVNLDESALPRIGSITGIDLSFDADIDAGTIYTVDLQSLFSKMVFDIKVDPTETNAEIFNANTFQLLGYTVSNLPKSVDLFSGEVGNTHDNLEIYDEAVEGVLGDDVNLQPATELSFTLYLPERFFKPATSADAFEYPFGTGNTIREEDKNLRQRYKPLLAKGYSSYKGSPGADNKATYVTISGVFTDHQGHTFDVDYDVYVGKDNYGNFDVVRNMQYNNTLTIKGINNSSDQGSGTVSVDHRVNVTHTHPIIVNLHRETLLDAHFEVRPLRIRANMKDELNKNGTVRANSAVKVEVIYSNGEGTKKPADKNNTNSNNWIGLERSMGVGSTASGQSLYCTSTGSSYGKRKYFTYGLVTGIQADNSVEAYNLSSTSTNGVVVPVTEKGECVWIYVDECTESSTDQNKKRSATIRLTYGTLDNSGNFQKYSDTAPIDYTIFQHYLFKLNWGGREYNIEHEEEYLYNFDAEDTYGINKTDFSGMPWGLDGIELSHNLDALYLTYTPSSLGGWIWNALLGLFGVGSLEEFCNEAVKESVKPFYDFYLTRDDVEGVTARDYKGTDFNREISAYLKEKFSTNQYAKIEDIKLDEIPNSAFAYCYNRNKRNSDGTVAKLNWILPAIDEIEDIMKSGHGNFKDFHGQYYWSCQPAYYKHNFSITYSGDAIKGSFFTENTTRARATKAELENGAFKDVVSSASDLYGTQYGEIKNNRIGIPSEYVAGNYVNNNDFDKNHTNHPGNKLRTEKCRVRAVYKP